MCGGLCSRIVWYTRAQYEMPFTPTSAIQSFRCSTMLFALKYMWSSDVCKEYFKPIQVSTYLHIRRQAPRAPNHVRDCCRYGRSCALEIATIADDNTIKPSVIPCCSRFSTSLRHMVGNRSPNPFKNRSKL